MRRAGTGVVADRPVFSTFNLNSAQSGKFWEDDDENLIFPRHFTQRGEGPSGNGLDFDGEFELSS